MTIKVVIVSFLHYVLAQTSPDNLMIGGGGVFSNCNKRKLLKVAIYCRKLDEILFQE